MSRVQQLLAGARMVGGGQVPRDVVPYGSGPSGPWPPPPAVDRKQQEGERQAGSRLVALCEAVLASHAETALLSFITDRLPDPLGARLVGCVLQLADDEDGARAWWQYAAGADDALSPYFLHLQHRKYGEREAATWWLERSPVERWTTPGGGDASCHAFDVSLPELLDLVVAGARCVGRARVAVVEALLAYVPAAVAAGHARHPAFDLPMPEAGFAERVRALLASSAADGRVQLPPRRADGTARLPVRRRPKGRPEA